MKSLFWSKEDRKKATFVSEYVDTLNKYGIESTEERVHFKAIVKEYPSLGEILDTSKEIKKFSGERKKSLTSDSVKGDTAVIFSKYVDTLNKYGIGSTEERIHYTMIVEDGPASLRNVLDVVKDMRR